MFNHLKLGNRGFHVSTLALGILFISIILGLFLLPALNKFVSKPLDGQLVIQGIVENRNVDERIKGIILSNPSFTGNLVFPDIGRNILIEEIETEYEEIIYSGTFNSEDDASERVVLAFEVSNKTDVRINFYPQISNGTYNYLYCIDVKYKDSTIVSPVFRCGRQGATHYVVAEDFIYDEALNVTRYGEYQLLMNSNTANVNIDYEVLTKKVISRTVRIVDGEKYKILKFNF